MIDQMFRGSYGTRCFRRVHLSIFARHIISDGFKGVSVRQKRPVIWDKSRVFFRYASKFHLYAMVCFEGLARAIEQKALHGMEPCEIGGPARISYKTYVEHDFRISQKLIWLSR